MSNYDVSAITDTDAVEIITKIKELVIRPGADLAISLQDAGIDAQGLAAQAGQTGPAGGRPPPPPGQGGAAKGRDTVDNAAVKLIADAVESFTSADATEADWSSVQASLEAAGYDTATPIVDYYV